MLFLQVSAGSATYGNGMGTRRNRGDCTGGTSLRADSGSMLRTVIGRLRIGEIIYGLSMLNVSIEQQLIAKGLSIVFAIALGDRLSTWTAR